MDKDIMNVDIPKISVIMPVYNTGLYVREAVDSILGQTMKDFELIIINDGSSDNSLQIIEELVATDHRITVYSQMNKGVSVARNLGLEKASGDYVYFMDSDDILDENVLCACYHKCLQDELDFVFFNAEIFSDTPGLALTYDYFKTKHLENGIYRGVDILLQMLNTRTYRASVCLNLIRSDFLKTIQLRFYPGIIHEDELFSAILYLRASRVSFLPEAYYKRRVRENSIMVNSFSLNNVVGYLTVLENIKTIQGQENESVKEAVEKLLMLIVNPMVYRASGLSLKSRICVMSQCIRMGCFKHVRCKNRWLLLFPILIKLKSYIK